MLTVPSLPLATNKAYTAVAWDDGMGIAALRAAVVMDALGPDAFD